MKHVQYINLPEKCPRESKRLNTKSKFHFPEDTFVQWTFLKKQWKSTINKLDTQTSSS